MHGNKFIKFCIKGLEKSYVPSERLFTIRKKENDKIEHYRDVFREYVFTMFSLLGLNHARQNGYKVFIDIESTYQNMLLKLDDQKNLNRCIAITIWAGRCIGTQIPHDIVSRFNDLVRNASQYNFDTKALGWLFAACLSGDDEYHEVAKTLANLVVEKYYNKKSSLVIEADASKLRRNWSFIGSHIYIAYAMLLFSRKTGDQKAKEIGLDIARKLVTLQGKNGEWAWMYHTPSGKISDYYPTYSIHQYGYAPLLLLEAMDLGYAEFREPVLKSFRWILGQNDINKIMVDRENYIIWRRMVRKGIYNSPYMKALKGYGSLLGVSKVTPGTIDTIAIDYQCHGFEMALPLYVFSGRSDLDEILNDNCFDTPEQV